mgnify:CR=1 FL=1
MCIVYLFIYRIRCFVALTSKIFSEYMPSAFRVDRIATTNRKLDSVEINARLISQVAKCEVEQDRAGICAFGVQRAKQQELGAIAMNRH